MTDEKKEKEPAKKDEARMTFTEHLGELRTRIVRSAIAIIVGAVFCYIFSNKLIEIIAYPLAPIQATQGPAPGADATPTPDNAEEGTEAEGGTEPGTEPGETWNRGVKWTILNPLEPVLVRLKLAAYGGILLALPYLLYHICGFIFPGLTAEERGVVKTLLFGCSLLAFSGVAVAYFGVFPIVLNYLLLWSPEWVAIQLRLNETISLILKGLLGFGLAFQFPMIVLILVYMNLLTPQTLKDYRRVAIVGMFVVGSLLTPPDPLTMVMMAAPLLVLYEMSIWLSYLVVRRKKRAAAEAAS